MCTVYDSYILYSIYIPTHTAYVHAYIQVKCIDIVFFDHVDKLNDWSVHLHKFPNLLSLQLLIVSNSTQRYFERPHIGITI